MRTGLTEEEKAYFDEKGFLIIENVLSPTEIRKLTEVIDELYERFGGEHKTGRLELRNCVSQHQLFLNLADHPITLPLVLDLIGPNIKIRSSEVDVRPPVKREDVKNELGRGRLGEPEQWHIDGPLFGFPSVGGILPMMEVKVGYYLTDLMERDSGTLCVVPGSHKLDYRLLMNETFQIPAEYIFKIHVQAGSVVVFRTGLWHCVSPNFSKHTRKVLYYAYSYRWIEPSDYILQPEELLSSCSPIQKQLLGAPISRERHPLGDQPHKKPCSFYWFTEMEDIPVLTWFDNLKKAQSTGNES
jgi:ectoine hydroxylase